MSPFEIVYGFNPLTPMDLVSLPLQDVVHADGEKKAKFVKDMHERVKLQIEKRNEAYAKQANKGRRRIIFEPGEWVWLHLRKERFPQARKNKLAPRGDGPFQVTKRIGDNAYVLDLPGDQYNVNATFNVCDLSPFAGEEEEENPRTDSSQEGENDEERLATKETQLRALQGIEGPMTRGRLKRAKAALQLMVQAVVDQERKREEQPISLHTIAQLEWQEGSNIKDNLQGLLTLQHGPPTTSTSALGPTQSTPTEFTKTAAGSPPTL